MTLSRLRETPQERTVMQKSQETSQSRRLNQVCVLARFGRMKCAAANSCTVRP